MGVSLPRAFGAIADPLLGLVKPKEPEPDIFQQVWLAGTRSVYVVVDAADRIRSGCDGLDKTLKLLSGLCVGAQLVDGLDSSFFGELGGTLKHIDGVFSGISVFGRWHDLTRLDKHGHRAITHKGPIKQASVAFLTIAKSCEFVRLLKTLGLVTSAALTNIDVQYLGGVCGKMGECAVFKVCVDVGLAGMKNFFLVLASTYAIINAAMIIIEGDADSYTTNRAIVGCLQDMGKIYLCSAAFAITGTWVIIAVATSVFGLTKILMDSYHNKPFEYPKAIRG